MAGDNVKKMQLLETLLVCQKEHPEFPWKYPRHTVLELARTYSQKQDYAQAVKLYDDVIRASSYSASSYTTKLAMLEQARLKFTLLSQDNTLETDPEVIAILNCLKDLEIQKNLYSEPLHLEASLEYNDIKTHFAPQNNKVEKRLIFLKRFKENFSSMNGDAAQEYHGLRQKLPEKDKLFQAYMKYADAEIIYLESLLATNEGQKENANLKKAEALHHFEALLKEQNLPDSLILRITRCQEAIKKA
jgi:hypothetical protein